MIERKLRLTANLTRRSSRFLSNELRNSYRLERRLQANSLRIKKKLVEERNRTLEALYRSSTEERKGRKGLSTLGGILGGGILAKGLRRRSPVALLRGRKAPTLSRGAKLSRLGRFGKIGPLAIIGTGLDFVGRKAEGQTNLQAGVGAAGGLGGALAGAKYGAILGTAVGGPIGTVVGGIGGSIIGGLAGGKLADLFTGADRRRQFEIEKNIILNQKTLFSDANDDLERVLDKFAIRVPRLDFAKRDDDDDRPRFLRIVIPIPREPVNVIKEFFKKPVVQDVSKIAVAATALILSRGKLRGSEKVIVDLLRKKPATFTKLPLEKQLQVIVKDIKKQNLIERISKSPFLTKRGTVVPGQKGAPAMSDRGKLIRNLSKEERGLLKTIRDQKKKDLSFINFLRRSKLQSPKQLKDDLLRVTNLENQKLQRLRDLGKITQKEFEKRSDAIFKLYKQERVRIDRYELELEDLFDKARLFKKAPKGEVNEGPKMMEDFIKKIRTIKKKTNFEPNKTFEKDLSSNFEPPDSTIAMASEINQPSENNFFIGGGNQTQQQPIVIDDSTSEAQTVNISNTYDNVTKYAEMTALMTV